MQAKIIERVVADLRAQSYRQGAQAHDAALVEAFVLRRDQAAFAALVQRHGPMVLGVCRRILGHAQDAEDAFQAAFWVLARKANSVRPRGLVGNWLYGVAVRTSLKARGQRRRRREKQVDAMPPQPVLPIDHNHDVQALLDEEIERLPAKYRLAVVLCELEGRGRKEAAQQLRVAEGTLSSRLAYARKLLARRLQARGVALSAGGALLASAAVPPTLLANTLQAASAAAPTSAAVSTLVKGVMTAMFLTKLKQITVAALLCAVVVGFGMGSRHLWGDVDAQEPAAAQNTAKPNNATPAVDPLVQPIQAGKLDAEPNDGLPGLWRLTRIDNRAEAAGGADGGAGPGPMGGGAAGPMGGGPTGAMHRASWKFNAYGAGGRFPPRRDESGALVPQPATGGNIFLQVTKDQATVIVAGMKITDRVKLGPGTIDMTFVDGAHAPDDAAVSLLGIYLINGNELSLGFGPTHVGRLNAPVLPQAKKPRPKTMKEAVEVWTFTRQHSRQQIYQKLDQLQGNWKAVSGESNGEAFLPRELAPVYLTIKDGYWKMTPPSQPGQPDAVPRRFFNAEYDFILDADSGVLILKGAGNRPMEQRMLYELRGDELKLCWNMRGTGQGGEESIAPTEFKTAPGSNLVLFVLKRESSVSLEDALQRHIESAKTNLGDVSPPSAKIQVRFAGPAGMKIRRLEAKEDKTAPVRLMFEKPGNYRLKLSNIPNRPGKELYPTLEIQPPNSPEASAFLANSFIPIELTEGEIEQAEEGALVTKYLWLPEAAEDNNSVQVQASHQRPSADQKGTMLAILRLGGIDLEPELSRGQPRSKDKEEEKKEK